MGIRTVAVYSDADAHALHVAACDEAYRLGPPPPRESYLEGDKIVAIAKAVRRAGDPPGLRLPVRERGLRRGCANARASCSSARRRQRSPPWGRSRPRNRSWARPACRSCPAITATTRIPRCSRARRAKIGYPGADQGDGGRRRQGHEDRQRGRRIRRGARLGAARGEGELRRRSRADRALSRPRRGTSRSRCSPTRTATRSTCSSAIARCSGGIRRCSRRRPRPA